MAVEAVCGQGKGKPMSVRYMTIAQEALSGNDGDVSLAVWAGTSAAVAQMLRAVVEENTMKPECKKKSVEWRGS